jgi:hypothetical protein
MWSEEREEDLEEQRPKITGFKAGYRGRRACERALKGAFR